MNTSERIVIVCAVTGIILIIIGILLGLIKVYPI